MLVSSGCRFPQTGWLKTMEMDSLSSGGQKSEPGLRRVRPLEALRGRASLDPQFLVSAGVPGVWPPLSNVCLCFHLPFLCVCVCVCVCVRNLPLPLLWEHLGGHLGPTWWSRMSLHLKILHWQRCRYLPKVAFTGSRVRTCYLWGPLFRLSEDLRA